MDATVSRRHVVFFGFPRVGHIRPTVAVVGELVRRGHRVSCVLAERYAEMAAGTGAEIIRYASDFPANLPALDDPAGQIDAVTGFLAEYFAPLSAVRGAFDPDPPDVVVEDALSTAVSGMVAERFGCPTVRTYPTFARQDAVSLSEVLVAQAATLPVGHPVVQFWSDLRSRLRRCGLDRQQVAAMTRGRAATANLVFLPRRFQPGAEQFDDRYVFVGPVDESRERSVPWAPTTGRSVVLVSLGTSSRHNPHFFRECAVAFEGTGWQVVMTTSGHVVDGSAGNLPAHVETHEWLDHESVLPHTAVIVCQAGMGTLMGAFRHGVPVVAVPQQPDARENAEQVARLGLGRALLNEIDGTAVRAAVLAVAADERCRHRVAAMRAAIERSGGVSRAADLIEQLTASQRP